jgi:hypothetical protein
MTTLDDIQSASDVLSVTDKQQLMLYLAASLQAQGAPLPNLPGFSDELGTDWMAEDEAAMRRFHVSASG